MIAPSGVQVQGQHRSQGYSRICDLSVGADAVLTKAPKLNRPTIGGGYPVTSNGFKVIELGHGKLASWVNLASALTGWVNTGLKQRKND